MAGEASWSAGRKYVDPIEQEAERKRFLAAVEGLNKLLLVFSKDQDFQEDLRVPLIQKAIRHWTGQERLPPEQAEAMFGDNYRIRGVQQKFRQLQMYCQQAGIPVPLDAVLQGKSALEIPGLTTPAEEKTPSSSTAKAGKTVASKPAIKKTAEKNDKSKKEKEKIPDTIPKPAEGLSREELSDQRLGLQILTFFVSMVVLIIAWIVKG